MKNLIKYIFIFLIIWSPGALCQTVPVSAEFLNLPVNIRGTSMGNLTVANGGDPNSIFTNPALIAFQESQYGPAELSSVALTYSPIASQLERDIKLITLNGYKWLDGNQYIGLSLRFFSIGDVHFYDEQANETNFVRPNEYSLGLSYVKKFSDNLSMGLTIKGIFSNLTGGINFQGINTKNAFGVAADLGLYGTLPITDINELTYGVAFTNIGSKLTYSSSENTIKSYLPMSLKFGGGYKFNMEENYLRLGLEFTKMLIPSSPVYDLDGSILKGESTDKTVPAAIFGSFADNPEGFAGEIKEFGISGGLEYAVKQTFFLRAGYYAEAKQMGYGSFASAGIGFKKEFNDNIFGIDLGYIMPSKENFSLKSSFKIGLSLSIGE